MISVTSQTGIDKWMYEHMEKSGVRHMSHNLCCLDLAQKVIYVLVGKIENEVKSDLFKHLKEGI